MATLEIDLNCMCLFVPDPRRGTNVGRVHVLMPATHHCHGGERHVVRMMFRGRDGSEQMRELEGWELVLGARPATARTRLEPSSAAADGTIVDLTELTRNGGEGGFRVPRTLIRDKDPSVACRIVLNAGEVIDLDAQDAEWELGGDSHVMAHRVTWRMELPTAELTWKNLLRQRRVRKPLASLDEVAPDVRGKETVYRLHVHHVTQKAFDKAREAGMDADTTIKFDPRVLDDDEIRDHFRMFYTFLGDATPEDRLLPRLVEDRRDPDGGGGGWACKLAQASAA